MKKTTYFLVMAALCLNFSLKAQDKSIHVKPLKIGDSIPEALWNLPFQIVNHPEGKKELTLGQFKDQLIILDFWATYCKPCIRSLVKLDSISQKIKTGFVVLPVQVYDHEERIMPFLKARGWKTISIVNDTLLNKVIFSKYLTGFGNVWIYKGKLMAVPIPPEITQEHIAQVLAGQQPPMRNLKELPSKY